MKKGDEKMQYDLESYRNNKCSYMLPIYPWEKKLLLEVAEKEHSNMRNLLQNALAIYIAQNSERGKMLKEGTRIIEERKKLWLKENENKELKKMHYHFRLFYWEKIVLFDKAEKENRRASAVLIDAFTIYLGSWNAKNKYSLIKKGKRRIEEVRQQWKNASESKHENEKK